MKSQPQQNSFAYRAVTDTCTLHTYTHTYIYIYIYTVIFVQVHACTLSYVILSHVNTQGDFSVCLFVSAPTCMPECTYNYSTYVTVIAHLLCMVPNVRQILILSKHTKATLVTNDSSKSIAERKTRNPNYSVFGVCLIWSRKIHGIKW